MTAELGFQHRFEPGRTPEAACLLLLHGTGGDEDDLMPLGRLLAPEAALLSPRGKILENGMPRFFRRLAEGVFDIDDLRLRAEELAGFVTAAAERYGFDQKRLTAVGFSNGANIAAAILLLWPETFFTAVLFRAMTPLVPEQLPDLRVHRVFLSAGRSDPIVAPENTQALAHLLRKSGARVTLDWSPGGHVIGERDVAAARAWLAVDRPGEAIRSQ